MRGSAQRQLTLMRKVQGASPDRLMLLPLLKGRLGGAAGSVTPFQKAKRGQSMRAINVFFSLEMGRIILL